MAGSDHLVGAFVFTISVSAFAEVARPLRILNMPLSAWLMLATWVLDGANWTASIAGTAIGGLLIALAIPRGQIRHRYGGWIGT